MFVQDVKGRWWEDECSKEDDTTLDEEKIKRNVIRISRRSWGNLR